MLCTKNSSHGRDQIPVKSPVSVFFLSNSLALMLIIIIHTAQVLPSSRG